MPSHCDPSPCACTQRRKSARTPHARDAGAALVQSAACPPRSPPGRDRWRRAVPRDRALRGCERCGRRGRRSRRRRGRPGAVPEPQAPRSTSTGVCSSNSLSPSTPGCRLKRQRIELRGSSRRSDWPRSSASCRAAPSSVSRPTVHSDCPGPISIACRSSRRIRAAPAAAACGRGHRGPGRWHVRPSVAAAGATCALQASAAAISCARPAPSPSAGKIRQALPVRSTVTTSCPLERSMQSLAIPRREDHPPFVIQSDFCCTAEHQAL